MHAYAAEHGVLVDDSDALPILHRFQGAFLSGGSGPCSDAGHKDSWQHLVDEKHGGARFGQFVDDCKAAKSDRP